MGRSDYKFDGKKLEVKINDKWKTIQIKNVTFSKVVGYGANGVVLKARHEILQRDEAVKIWLPNKQSVNNRVSKEQYLEEIRKIDKIKSQCIPKVYDADSIDGVYYAEMEFVDGNNLRQIEDNSCMISEQDRLHYAKEILVTMIECYRKEIYHGDLHLGNIMLSKDGKIKILDFGTSLYVRGTKKPKQRECELLVATICKIVGWKQLSKYTKLRVPREIQGTRRLEPIGENDIRLLEPMEIARTLLGIIKIIQKLGMPGENKVNYIYMGDNEFEEIYELVCEYPNLKIDSVFEVITAGAPDNIIREIYDNMVDYMRKKFYECQDKYLIAYVHWEIIERHYKMYGEQLYTGDENYYASAQWKKAEIQKEMLKVKKAIKNKVSFWKCIEQIQEQFRTNKLDFDDNPIDDIFEGMQMIISVHLKKEITSIDYWQEALNVYYITLNDDSTLSHLNELKEKENKWVNERWRNATYSTTPDFKKKFTYAEMIQNMPK